MGPRVVPFLFFTSRKTDAPGAAVHQLRAGVPLSEVQQQLGHARIDTKLTNRERRSDADRVER